jgi:uncharacterized protein (TIRG00374 family)
MNKSILSVIIGSAAGLVLLIIWFLNIDSAYLLEAIRQVDYRYIIAGGVFYLSAYFIRSVRWNLLLRNQIKLSYRESWLVSIAGNWINYLIPIRAGEIVKAVMIKKLRKVSAVSILPSVFIDKFFDTLGIFFVLIMIPCLKIQISTGLRFLIILLIIMFAIVFLILFLAAKNKEKVAGLLQFFFFWLPSSIRQKIYNLIEMFVGGLNILEHHNSIIVYSVILTALGVILDAAYFYALFLAFGIGVNFFVVTFGYTLINLSYALPQPPAQLGSNEWMMIIIFSIGFGLTKNAVSAIMVFAHIFTAFIITGFGIIGFSYSGIKSLKQIQKEF